MNVKSTASESNLMKQQKKLPPGIRRRTDGSFQIRYYVKDAHGKPERVHETVIGTLTEAKATRLKRLGEEQRGVHVRKSETTVREYIDEWLEKRASLVKLSRFSATTLHRYRNLTRYQIYPRIGGVRVSDVTPLMLESLYATLEATGAVDGGPLSPTTVRQAHNIISAALRSAVRDGILSTSPASSDRLEKRPTPTKPDIKFLEPSDLERLIVAVASARKHRRFLIPVLLGGVLAMRRGEVLGLQWSDVDFERAKLTVSRALEEVRIPEADRKAAEDGTALPRYRLSFKLPKSGKKRRLAIPLHVLEELRKHRLGQKKMRLAVGPAFQDRDLVVCESDGSEWKPRSFTPAFISTAGVLGFKDLYFHALRHTAIASLIRTGEHPKVIQEIAGHATAGFTMDRYGHVSDSLQEQAMARVNDLVLGTTVIPDAEEATG